MKILAIETSCDETSAAVVEDGRVIRSNAVASQIDTHRVYGGVVPEIAARAHAEALCPVTREALAQAGETFETLDAVAVSAYPGLIGALLCGVNFAKGLALSLGLPLVPVHHMKGHVAANYLATPGWAPPFLCLVVSGGHTLIVEVESETRYRRLGTTRDDAAGEAFDKVGRMMGLAYPGGVSIDRLCREGGNDAAYAFPHSRIAGAPLDCSFSGVKTAALNLLHNAAQRGEPVDRHDFAASFARHVCGELTSRIFLAADETGAKRIALAGGVAANSTLRRMVAEGCAARGLELSIPPLSLCGDNAAMIAAQAYFELRDGHTADMRLNAKAVMPL